MLFSERKGAHYPSLKQNNWDEDTENMFLPPS